MKIDPVPQQLPEPNPRPTAKTPKEAAVQFESLLISQMLKSARGEQGWMGSGEDQAGGTMMEVAEESLAQALASRGGMGLANMVMKGLEKKS